MAKAAVSNFHGRFNNCARQDFGYFFTNKLLYLDVKSLKPNKVIILVLSMIVFSVLDFGDSQRSCYVFELAITIMYMMTQCR